MEEVNDRTNYPTSHHGGDSSQDEERDEIQEIKKMSQQDTERVNVWRLVVFAVILAVAVTVTLTTFLVLKREEDNDFKIAVSRSFHCISLLLAINGQLTKSMSNPTHAV